MYLYNAKPIRVVDGDTFEFDVDLGFRIHNQCCFRLKGVDTPEIWRPKSDAELDLGRKAKEFVERMFEEADSIQIQSTKLGVYGRWEADVYLNFGDETVSLADLLAANKLLKENVDEE